MIQERQTQILQLLQKHSYLSTEQLAQTVFASMPTIRRDLKALEQRGLIRRTRGGASPAEVGQQLEIPLSLRQRERIREKAQIAREALKLIHRGSTLFLDSSTTVYQLARLLPADWELTVVTNSIRAGLLLSQRKIRTYLIGGILNESFFSTGGGYAQDMALCFHADIMFFSANALSMAGEITDFSENEARLRQQMFTRSDRRCFLCDSGKIGKSSLHHLCWAWEVDDILCDTPLPEELILTPEK